VGSGDEGMKMKIGLFWGSVCSLFLFCAGAVDFFKIFCLVLGCERALVPREDLAGETLPSSPRSLSIDFFCKYNSL